MNQTPDSPPDMIRPSHVLNPVLTHLSPTWMTQMTHLNQSQLTDMIHLSHQRMRDSSELDTESSTNTHTLTNMTHLNQVSTPARVQPTETRKRKRTWTLYGPPWRTLCEKERKFFRVFFSTTRLHRPARCLFNLWRFAVKVAWTAGSHPKLFI